MSTPRIDENQGRSGWFEPCLAFIGERSVQYKELLKKDLNLLIQIVIAAVWGFFELPIASTILGFTVGGFVMDLAYKSASSWDVKFLKSGIKKVKVIGNQYPHLTTIILVVSIVVNYQSTYASGGIAMVAGAFVALKFKIRKRELEVERSRN